MTPRLNCVDMSKWGGELTPTEAQAMYDLGIRNIKVGVGWSGVGGAGQWSRQQATTWLAVAPDVTADAYIYLYMAGDATAAVTQALGVLEGVPIRHWWLDAEDTESPELSSYQRAEFLRTCLTAIAPRKVGIYTGQWWWRPMMLNSTAFSHLPLWNSYYDGDPDTDGLPYGGWTDSAVEQYGDTQYVGGQSVDVNYDKLIDLEEDAVTITEYEDLLLAQFSGKEEAGLTRAERLTNARYRVGEIAAGRGYSVAENAANALVHALEDDPTDGLTEDEVKALLSGARIVVGA